MLNNIPRDAHSLKQNTWNSISLIQEACSIPDNEMANIMDISTNEFITRKSGNFEIMPYECMGIYNKFHLDFVHLATSTFDLDLVVDRYIGINDSIHLKYQKNSFSKKRTQLNILNYLAENYNHILDHAFRYFQINKSCFDNPDESIRLKFLEDLCSYLSLKGFKEKDFYEMGLHSYETNKDSVLANKYSECGSMKKILDLIFDDLIIKYDQNFDYEIIKLNNFNAILKETPSQKLVESESAYKIGSEQTTIVKTGVIASLPRFIGRDDAHVEITKSIYQGDSYTQFDISF